MTEPTDPFDDRNQAEWEDFTRMRLQQGGDLAKYYPLRDDARAEYEEWRKKNPV